MNIILLQRKTTFFHLYHLSLQSIRYQFMNEILFHNIIDATSLIFSCFKLHQLNGEVVFCWDNSNSICQSKQAIVYIVYIVYWIHYVRIMYRIFYIQAMNRIKEVKWTLNTSTALLWMCSFHLIRATAIERMFTMAIGQPSMFCQ